MSFNTVLGPADVRVVTHPKSMQAFMVLGVTVVATGLLAMVTLGLGAEVLNGSAPLAAIPVVGGLGASAVATAIGGSLLARRIVRKAREKWSQAQRYTY